MTQLFVNFPDNCAGDVLDFFKMTISRTEALDIATHCSSPEAHAWVRAVVAAAIAVSVIIIMEHAGIEQRFSHTPCL
jgi:hypothetical protein